MIAASFGALAVGLSLGLLGSGGSILTVPVLVYLLHQPTKVAIAGSLAIVAAIALIGAGRYAQQRLRQVFGLFLIAVCGFILWRTVPELLRHAASNPSLIGPSRPPACSQQAGDV